MRRLILLSAALAGWAVFVWLAWKPILVWCWGSAVRFAGDNVVDWYVFAHVAFAAWVITMISPGLLVAQAFILKAPSQSRTDRRAEQLSRDWS